MMRAGPPTLRREIIVWYSVVLLVALGVFAGITYALLDRALARAEVASLRQTADAVEHLQVPRGIPRLGTRDETVSLADGRGEALRRTIILATGDVVEIVVASGVDVKERALGAFLLIALMLIPLTAAAAAFGGGKLLEPLLAPLNRLVGATREVGIGRLSTRVEEPARPAELRDLARAYNAMLARLDAAVGELRNFTGDASHELRTPLTAIRGNIQVALSRDRSEAELREALSEVMTETEWMLHLIDGLLALARNEEDERSIVKERLDLTALLEDVVEVAEALAAGSPKTVRSEIEEGLEIPGSPARLRQVFLNLASNAVKFTEGGEITIGAEARGDGVLAWVRDTGMGIPEDELPRVFDRFYRGSAGRAREGGSGLGLAIAKLLVEQHGGEITVRSRAGMGSEFEVWLPGEAGFASHQRA